MRVLSTVLLGLCLLPGVAAGRSVVFSGLTWDVRAGAGGPGNGCWSDALDAVWVDGQGLHLRMTQDAGGNWCQAEVIARAFARHGEHRFSVVKDLDDLDDDLVLALFAYRNDFTEIDMELTQAFNATHDKGWNVVHGCNFVDTHAVRNIFDFTMSGAFSTHKFIWGPSQIDFESYHGHCPTLPCGGQMGSGWSYTGVDVPNEWENLRPHISLWQCTQSWCQGDGVLDVAAGPHEVVIAAYDGSVVKAMAEVAYSLPVQRDAGLRGGSFSSTNYGGEVGGDAEQRLFGYGNDDSIFLSPGAAPLRVALRFDLSTLPSNQVVAAADLHLGFQLAVSASICPAGNPPPKTDPLFCYETFKVTPYLSAWGEQTITWGNRPLTDGTEAIDACFPESGFNPSASFLITPLVDSWHSGALVNHGIELSVESWETLYPKARYYLQREGVGFKPEMTVYLIEDVFEDDFESGNMDAWDEVFP